MDEENVRGVGSALFVGILLMIVGVLNFFYGIAAVANSSFYVKNVRLRRASIRGAGSRSSWASSSSLRRFRCSPATSTGA